MGVRPERVDRQADTVARTQDLERRTRLGRGQQAELQTHGLGFHQPGHVLDLGNGHVAADTPHPVGHRDAAGDPGLQQLLHRSQRHHGDDARAPHRVHPLAGCQDTQHLLGHAAHRGPFVAGLVGSLFERFPQRRVVGVGSGQVANRSEQLQDLIGGFLDLAHPLEIPDRAVVVLDADPQQGQRRDFQQLGEALDGIKLDHLTLFIAVERGTRHPKPGGDFFGTQARLQAVCPKLLADLGEPHGHPPHPSRPHHPALRSFGLPLATKQTPHRVSESGQARYLIANSSGNSTPVQRMRLVSRPQGKFISYRE